MRTDDPKDPINALYGEHDEALEQLKILGASGRAMAKSGVTSAELAAFETAVRFLDNEIRAHNEWEEVNLFPRLEARTGPGGPCMVMRAEHRELWGLYGTLGPLLTKAKAASVEQEALTSLAEVAGAIERLLSQHIAKENEILFPMARNVLTADDLQAMRAARPAH